MWQRLGQHFLSDKEVLLTIRNQIFHVRDEMNLSQIIEVWPGQGVLTQEIMQWFDTIVALEADISLKNHINRLSKQANNLEMSFSIVWWDVLQADLSEYNQTDRLVVWNLPYYITSPILRQFFVDHQFSGGVFLIQKEVAQKIATDAKKKSYLRWLLRYYCFVAYNFTVQPNAFTPPPKVDSAVVTIRLHNEHYWFSIEELQQFLDIVSPFSRKTLGKIQKMREKELVLSSCSIPQKYWSKRLEALSWDEITDVLIG